MAGKESLRGLMTPGNINLYKRPRVVNPDGSISTVRSMSFEDEGREVLVPTTAPGRDISGRGPLGRIMSDSEAMARFRRTGEHLGMFDNPANATSYAGQLHDEYEAGKYDRPLVKRKRSRY